MKTLLPLVGMLSLAPLHSWAQTSSAPVSSSAEAQDPNPMVQMLKAYPQDPSRIPLQSPEGKQTTLGAIAPRVLLVSFFTSRFGNLAELKQAPHLMKRLAGRKDVAFIAVNVDRPKSPEDWDTLRQVLKEEGVQATLYSDTQLSLLAWVNGLPGSAESKFARVPALAIVLDGKTLHGRYGIDPNATPEEYVTERLDEVNEALKAVGAPPVKPPAAAPKPVKATKPSPGH